MRLLPRSKLLIIFIFIVLLFIYGLWRDDESNRRYVCLEDDVIHWGPPLYHIRLVDGVPPVRPDCPSVPFVWLNQGKHVVRIQYLNRGLMEIPFAKHDGKGDYLEPDGEFDIEFDFQGGWIYQIISGQDNMPTIRIRKKNKSIIERLLDR